MTGREEDLLRLTAREGPLSLFCALSVSACLPPAYLRSGSLRREVKVKSLSRVRLCDPMDCSLPGSSVHGVLQARILEWVAISFYAIPVVYLKNIRDNRISHHLKALLSLLSSI